MNKLKDNAVIKGGCAAGGVRRRESEVQYNYVANNHVTNSNIYK